MAPSSTRTPFATSYAGGRIALGILWLIALAATHAHATTQGDPRIIKHREWPQ